MDLNSIFTQIRDKLDAHYDRRERLIKISRDITSLSKKMIFSLQRIRGEVQSLPAGIQKEIDQRDGEIQKLLEKAEPDIRGANAERWFVFTEWTDIKVPPSNFSWNTRICITFPKKYKLM